MDQTTELRCSFIRRRMSWGAGASQTRSIRNWTATKSSGTSSLFIEHATTNSRQDFRLAPNDRGSLEAIGYGAGAPCGHARVITPSWHARNIGDGLPLRLGAGEARVVPHRQAVCARTAFRSPAARRFRQHNARNRALIRRACRNPRIAKFIALAPITPD